MIRDQNGSLLILAYSTYVHLLHSLYAASISFLSLRVLYLNDAGHLALQLAVPIPHHQVDCSEDHSLPSYLANIHSYGTLLGTEVFHSFIAGVTAYKVLPRPQFATLQSALFPIYFSMQTALPLILALTFSGGRTAISRIPSSISGVLDPSLRTHVFTPLTIVLVTGLANLVYVGPKTTSIMRERKHQETRDGKKSYDIGPQSEAMQALNKKFGVWHGVSSLVNMVGCITTLWYGFYLAERIL
jgi:hypothetical protein